MRTNLLNQNVWNTSVQANITQNAILLEDMLQQQAQKDSNYYFIN